MPTYKLLTEDRVMDIEVGAPSFRFALDNLGYRKLCFFEVRETEFKNMIWMRAMAISFKPPFIRFAGGFMIEGGEL